MSSPFLGMDPYLEDPGLWPDVHNSLIVVAREFLIRQLGPPYYARIEERVYISDEDDPGREVIIPDVRIGKRRGSNGPAVVPGTAGIAVTEPLVVTTLIDEEIHEPYLSVIDRDDRSVVTVIEVTSPTNKVAESRGRASYRQKRAEVRNSSSHWMEIDLLRQGVPCVPQQVRPLGDYFVYLSRAHRRRRTYVWPVRLPERLPVVAIPLKKGDPDVPLDLQAVLNTVYDRAGYDRVINYRRPPEIPLTKEQATWANEVLRSQGLR